VLGLPAAGAAFVPAGGAGLRSQPTSAIVSATIVLKIAASRRRLALDHLDKVNVFMDSSVAPYVGSSPRRYVVVRFTPFTPFARRTPQALLKSSGTRPFPSHPSHYFTPFPPAAPTCLPFLDPSLP
jgi:hypothetical protein